MAVCLLQLYSYIHTSWGSGSWSFLSVQEREAPHHRGINCSQWVPFKMQFTKAEVFWKYWKKKIKGQWFLFLDSGESPEHYKTYCHFTSYRGSKNLNSYWWLCLKINNILLTFMLCHKITERGLWTWDLLVFVIQETPFLKQASHPLS